MLRMNVPVFGLETMENTEKVYLSLINNLIPMFPEFKGIRLLLENTWIVADEVTDMEVSRLQNICLGISIGMGLIK